jgi:hypothetical protein
MAGGEKRWAAQRVYAGVMQPIIRRTITITVTESWTITWADGRATSWHETHEVVYPAVHEPDELLPPLTADEASDDNTLEPDAADQDTEDE